MKDDGRLQGAVGRGRDLAAQALAWLQTLASPLRRLATVLRWVAWIGIVAAGLVVVAAQIELWPPSLGSLLGLAVVFVLLAFCPWGLLTFSASVDAVAGIPDLLVSSPDLYRRHAGEIVDLYRNATDPATGRTRGVGGGAFGALKIMRQVRNDIPELQGVLALGRLSLVLIAAAGIFMSVFNLFFVLPLVLGWAAVHS